MFLRRKRRWGAGGAFTTVPGQHPAVIVQTHTKLEALLRIYARGHDDHRASHYGRMIGEMSETVDDRGRLGRSKVPGPLVAEDTNGLDDENPVREWLKDLEEAERPVGEGNSATKAAP